MPEVVISPVAKGLTLVCAALSPPDSTLRGSLYSNAKGKGQDARCRMLGLFSWRAIQQQNERPMNDKLFAVKKAALAGAAILVPFALLDRKSVV